MGNTHCGKSFEYTGVGKPYASFEVKQILIVLIPLVPIDWMLPVVEITAKTAACCRSRLGQNPRSLQKLTEPFHFSHLPYALHSILFSLKLSDIEPPFEL